MRSINEISSSRISILAAGDARHPGHDAGGHQAEQGAHDPTAPERGLALLEGQHPVEGW